MSARATASGSAGWWSREDGGGAAEAEAEAEEEEENQDATSNAEETPPLSPRLSPPLFEEDARLLRAVFARGIVGFVARVVRGL